MKKKFVRQDSVRYSKLGKNRKKLQKWRKPKGRHSKIRQKWKSYPQIVSIGFKKDKKESQKINGKETVVVYNSADLEKAKGRLVILGSVGSKKKIELIKMAEEKGIEVINVRKKK